MRRLGLLLVSIWSHKYMDGIAPKKALLNRSYRKPELREFVGFTVSLEYILEFTYFEVQLPGGVGILRHRSFSVDVRLVH